jgi:hypothetical protein
MMRSISYGSYLGILFGAGVAMLASSCRDSPQPAGSRFDSRQHLREAVSTAVLQQATQHLWRVASGAKRGTTNAAGLTVDVTAFKARPDSAE